VRNNKPTLAHLSPPKALSPEHTLGRLSPTSVLDALSVLPALPQRAGQLSALKNRSRHPSLPRVHTAALPSPHQVHQMVQRPLTSFLRQPELCEPQTPPRAAAAAAAARAEGRA
jgi:hypothetical protein